MNDQSARMTGGEIGRWFLVALLLATCIALYFRYAPATPIAVHPAGVEAAP
jgi:hypothetical protein